MGSGQQSAKSSDGRWQKLSEEQQESILAEVKRWLEEGYCQMKMDPPLLGLDWSSFALRKCPQYPGQAAVQNPPEFTSYAFPALDAYASAILTTHSSFLSLGCLSFTCSLKKDNAFEPRMHLKFVTKPERGRIDPGSVMPAMLRSFPTFLKAQGIEAGEIFFLEGEGCAMRFAYPGRMSAKASPFLRDRPDDLWPEATLALTPTDELRNRAGSILAFLMTSTSLEGNPN